MSDNKNLFTFPIRYTYVQRSVRPQVHASAKNIFFAFSPVFYSHFYKRTNEDNITFFLFPVIEIIVGPYNFILGRRVPRTAYDSSD